MAFAFLSGLDLLLTLLILGMGGTELNPVANAVLPLGYYALILYKASWVIFFIISIEIIGIKKPDIAERMSTLSLVVVSTPVCVATVLLFVYGV